ncbi:MAG TPA: NUDIX hydrolase [Vicinamibacteria bacterium]|nr:NUDIX hydrolase [Vicinamibacteria bacterium]
MTLAEALARHVPADAKEAADLRTIVDFVSRHPIPFDRRIAEGHLTGSAFVGSHDGERVLLLHHRKLHAWLQPGGHGDPGESAGEQVALREAIEETGLDDLALHPTAPRPLDVDVHLIPARTGEPAHLHLDLRYLFRAGGAAALHRAAAESNDLRWFAWAELPTLTLDPGLVRGLAKARAHLARMAL